MSLIWIFLIVYAAIGLVFSVIVAASDIIHRRNLTGDFVFWFFGWGVFIIAIACSAVLPKSK